jgi:hypothetical protein
MARMFIYSRKIVQFICEIQSAAKEILAREIGVKVYGNRFYNRRGTCSYPIKIVVYNNKKLLGYFESELLELGFHQCLMSSSKEQLRNVIRHELAHYMTFIDSGQNFPPHGALFKSFCQTVGWDDAVSQATFCLDGAHTSPISVESGVFRKIQKLMALATSNNTHEAEQAIIKSQQLLLKHNIEAISIGDEDVIYMKRIMKQKKENAKMRSIANILETFFVSPVYSRGKGYTHLEIVGTAVNIEVAEYVAGFLERELDVLWNQARMRAVLRGLTAKNSFFLGIAKGYCDKIQALKRAYPSDTQCSIIVIEKKLIDALAVVYPNLRTGRGYGGHCAESAALGEQMGRQLNINPVVKQSTEKSNALIGHV